MAGMRQILYQLTLDFKPKEGFDVEIPQRFLDDNTESERQKVIFLWKDVQKTAREACAARCYHFSNKQLRKTAFRSQMEKLFQDFSRRSEKIKVSFRTIPRPGFECEQKEDYQLVLKQLTDIPDYAINAPVVTAEVPPLMVMGEYVSVSDDRRREYAFSAIPTVQPVYDYDSPGVVSPSLTSAVVPIVQISSEDAMQMQYGPTTPCPTIYISETDRSRNYDQNIGSSGNATAPMAVAMAITPTAPPLSNPPQISSAISSSSSSSSSDTTATSTTNAQPMLYENVIHRGQRGALRLTPAGMVFKSNHDATKTIRLPYQSIQKIQIHKAKILIKFVLRQNQLEQGGAGAGNGNTSTIFGLDGVSQLEQLRRDVHNRLS